MPHGAKRLLLCLLAGLCLLVSLSAREANAQVLYGSVSGTITDASSAVIPGATLTITNDQTTLRRETKTDAAGQFRFLDLPEGTYTLTAAAQGFETYKQTGVSVLIGQVNLQNLQLGVGTTTQEVTVQGSTVVLETQKADVHTEISTTAVENLPLDAYRNFQSTELLAPGVISLSAMGGGPSGLPNSQADTPDRSFSIDANGMPERINTTRVDGATDIFIWLPNHMLVVPPAETIEEVNVQTSNYDVEKGLTAGVATDVVTKSGSNQMHGSLYAFNTVNAVDANNWYNYTGNSKNIQNNDGITLGGAIKKNRLFYFLNWDGSWQDYAETYTDLIAPTAFRTGDFSTMLGPQLYGPNNTPLNVCTTEGATVPLQEGMVFDPSTGNADGTDRCVFSYQGKLNVMPASRINQGAQNFWALLPPPNQNVPLTYTTPFNYDGTKDVKWSRQIYTAKIDWNRNDRHTVWGKWTYQDAVYFEPYDFGLAGGGGTGNSYDTANIATLGHTWTISPTMVLTGHVGFDRMGEHATPPGYGSDLGLSVLGIPGANAPLDDPRYSGLPGISMQGFTSLGGVNSWEPVNRNDWTFTTSHNLTWVKGTHEIRMGIDAAHNHLNHWQPEIVCCPRGYLGMTYGPTTINLPADPNNPDNGVFMNLFTSNGQSAGTGYSGFDQNSVALFDLGLIANADKSEQFIKSTGKDWQWGMYVGDRWKVKHNLTADLGLRWEYYPLITRDGIDKDELYDPTTNTEYFGGLGGNPTHLGITTSKTLFNPRVGLAYQFKDKMVVRAGFGLSNDTLPLERPLRGFYPLAIGASDFVPSTNVSWFQTYDTFSQGLPIIQNPDISSGKTTPPPDVTIGTLAPGEFKRGYVLQWNSFVERTLPGGFLLDVGYVGNHFVHEFNGRDLNVAPLFTGSAGQPLGQFGRYVSTYQFAGYLDSHYSALQVALNRRTSKGLFIQGAYTWSRTMGYVNDNSWENGLEFNCPPSSAMPQGCQQLNYGPTNFDHTQVFKMAFVYELPFGANKKFASSNRITNAVAGGWQVNGIFTALTGDPISPSQDQYFINTPGTPQNPWFQGKIHYTHKANDSLGYPTWFASTDFAPNLLEPSAGAASIGNMPRDVSWFRGPGVGQLDASLFRHFKFKERYDLEFRFEAQNVTNNPHFADPNNYCQDVNGVCGGGFGELTYGSFGQRLVMMGIKLKF